MDSAGAKSTMSRDMEEITQGKETISRSVAGHKANLSNPSMCTALCYAECIEVLTENKTRARLPKSTVNKPSRIWEGTLLIMAMRKIRVARAQLRIWMGVGQ